MRVCMYTYSICIYIPVLTVCMYNKSAWAFCPETFRGLYHWIHISRVGSKISCLQIKEKSDLRSMISNLQSQRSFPKYSPTSRGRLDRVLLELASRVRIFYSAYCFPPIQACTTPNTINHHMPLIHGTWQAQAECA